MGLTGDRCGRFSVLMLPWLAHGHASPFLELAKRLSSCRRRRHHVLIHLCSTPATLDTIREQLNQEAFPSVHLVELHLPLLPGLAPDLHTTKHLPSHLMPLLKHAFDLAEPDFDHLLDLVRPDLLVYDFLQPWAPLAASRRNIPAIQFLTTSASFSAFFCHYLRSPDEEFPFPALCLGVRENSVHAVRMNTVANGVSDSERFFQCMERSTGFVAIRTFREIESKYIDHLSRVLDKEMVPVGPLVPDDVDDNGDLGRLTDEDSESERSIIAWLDAKERSSVVLATFGSEYFMNKEEMREVARGLELSGLSFIWVVRLPKGKDAAAGGGGSSWATDLPCGFMERVVKGEGRGWVVEGWAPQRKILHHPGVGGFLTHCGWSSVMEAMKYGVPIVALPLQLDQPGNSKLVEEIGMGVEVRRTRGVLGKFLGEEVAKGIRIVVVDEEGLSVRTKARQMAHVIRGKGEEEIQVLLEKMCAICEEAGQQSGMQR